jgi:hypothetical protein
MAVASRVPWRTGTATRIGLQAQPPLSPKGRAMVDFFVERFGECPDWDVSAAA